VVGVADEPIEYAGDVGGVNLWKVRRVESGRLWTRRTIFVCHAVTLCTRQNSKINIQMLKIDYRHVNSYCVIHGAA